MTEKQPMPDVESSQLIRDLYELESKARNAAASILLFSKSYDFLKDIRGLLVLTERRMSESSSFSPQLVTRLLAAQDAAQLLDKMLAKSGAVLCLALQWENDQCSSAELRSAIAEFRNQSAKVGILNG